jgi:hypothetical protein
MVGHNEVVKVNQLMCRNVFVGVVGQVKGQRSNATEMFIGKLEMCFQNSELMNALSISTLAPSKNSIVN